MKILVYGAGVLGTLYAAGLYGSGEDVTLLARGNRLHQARDHGLVLENAITREWTFCHVPVVDRLTPNDEYDLIIVLTRKDQLYSILPVLSANHRVPAILFMQIDLHGYQSWINAVGYERFLVGYAGAGGQLEGHIVRYCIAPAWLQPTMIGEPDGSRDRRTKQVAAVFRTAGFPLAISSNISAWQKSHAAWITPLTNGLYVAGDRFLLSRRPDVIRLTIQAMREGLRALHALDVPVCPFTLHLLEHMPESILIKLVQRFSSTEHFRMLVEANALSSFEEMQVLSDEFRELALDSRVPMPATTALADLVRRSSIAATVAGQEIHLVA